MDAAAILALLQIVLTLEPAAFAAVQSFANGLSGKTDAEVLAMDQTELTAIIKIAQS